jgi:hypothetical protein
LGAGADEGFGEARFVRVGDGNGIDEVEGLPNGVESVAIVAAAGVADDGGAVAAAGGGA